MTDLPFDYPSPANPGAPAPRKCARHRWVVWPDETRCDRDRGTATSTVFRLATAGRLSTGDPDIDGALARYSMQIPGMS